MNNLIKDNHRRSCPQQYQNSNITQRDPSQYFINNLVEEKSKYDIVTKKNKSSLNINDVQYMEKKNPKEKYYISNISNVSYSNHQNIIITNNKLCSLRNNILVQ